MATSGLYGSSPTGAVVAAPGSETAGLYGSGTVFGGTYFEWFIFQESATAPATPTGGSWSFTTNTGTAPAGWSSAPPTSPTNTVWFSIALVNSRDAGNLTWTTPAPFSEQGPVGPPGPAATVTAGTTTTGAAGTSASVTNVGTTSAAVFNFVIPRGDTGSTGTAATVAVGTTTTGAAGTSANVTNSGTTSAATFNFTIPRGDTGATGATGAQGPQGIPGTAATIDAGTTTTGAAGSSASVTNVGTSSAAVFNFSIPRGDTGATGATGATGTAATIAVGTTTTGAAGTPATVTNVGTSSAAVFDFSIPQGAGVPTGGTTGQVLAKASSTNYDTAWLTITGGLSYQGSWNASTNTPTLTSGAGTAGTYYVVNVAGSTNLDGITDWLVGDWAIFNGTIWQKIDQTNAVTSVNGQTGGVVLDAGDVGALASATSSDGSITINQVGTNIDLTVSVASPASTLLTEVRNTTGATLTKGTVVYISGATGQISTVSKAIATGDATSAQTLGMITADLPNNTNGYVTVFGLIEDINTSAYTDGAQLYLSGTTAGAVTTTKPSAPIHLVYVGVVEYAHPTQGKILVKVQNGYELDEIHDVSINAPVTGQTIVYNASTDLWENNTVSLTAGVNGTLPVANGGTGQTSYTDGQLLIGNSTGNTLTKATLTAGSGISITNGAGSISIAATNSGTVTSVTGTSPVLSSGGATPDISLASGYGDTQNPYASKSANYILAAPNGSTGVPTFRPLAVADVPTLNQNTTGTAANVTGIVAVANGGTGTTTPSLVAGSNVTITGTWPNQTIASTGGGGGGGSGTSVTQTAFTATAGQTTFTVTYVVGQIDVYMNGSKLLIGTDVTATSGTNIVLASGAAAGDIIEAVVYSSQWITSGSNLYYNSGNVSVGTTTANARFDVDRAHNFAGGVSVVASNPQLAITNSYQYGYPTGMLFKSVLQSGGSIVNNASIWSEWSSDNNAYLGFATTSGGTLTERARIPAAGGFQSVGSISVGNATPTTSGAGITFPATQSASSDANTLDDYEEGTWTPTVLGSSTAGTGTYTHQIGTYVKVGQMVCASALITITNHTGTGNLLLGGLPFSTSNTSGLNRFGVAIGGLNNLALTASNVAMAKAASNETILYVTQYPVGGGAETDVPIDTNFQIMYTFTYRCTA